jgi:hypothetical protein
MRYIAYAVWNTVTERIAIMPVTPDKAAPYAPASAVLGLIERHRNKGLPAPVDADVLGRAGISGSLIPRTLQALQALDLIDEQGKPTEILEGLRLAPEAEYKQRMAEWLNGAYADALSYVDPSTADETAIRDAFRSYKPVGQQPRMVSLFMGLFAAAGIAAEKQRQPPRKLSAPAKRPRPTPKLPPNRREERHPPTPGDLPPPIAGLLTSLPSPDEGWSKAKRDRFVQTFAAVLDYCFPVVEDAPDGRDETEEMYE